MSMTIFNINDNYSFSMFLFFGDNEWCDDWKLYKSFLSENSDAQNIKYNHLPWHIQGFIPVTCLTNESKGADFLQLIFLLWFGHRIAAP